jgi:hypothetical protein
MYSFPQKKKNCLDALTPINSRKNVVSSFFVHCLLLFATETNDTNRRRRKTQSSERQASHPPRSSGLTDGMKNFKTNHPLEETRFQNKQAVSYVIYMTLCDTAGRGLC